MAKKWKSKTCNEMEVLWIIKRCVKLDSCFYNEEVHGVNLYWCFSFSFLFSFTLQFIYSTKVDRFVDGCQLFPIHFWFHCWDLSTLVGERVEGDRGHIYVFKSNTSLSFYFFLSNSSCMSNKGWNDNNFIKKFCEWICRFCIKVP